MIDSKTHNNVETTVASLTAELFSANKNPMEALRGNVHPENLLGKCRLGGCTSKKMVTGGFLRATHYWWSCGYKSVHPNFKCTGQKTVHVMNTTEANMQGGSEKKNPTRGWIGQEYIANNISNFNYSKIPERYQGCIKSWCIIHCARDHVMVTGNLPVLQWICDGQLDANTMRSH